jgi:hypothetical protein
MKVNSTILGGRQYALLTSRAAVCPTKPLPEVSAVPSFLRPSPLICVWAAVLFSRELPLTSLRFTMVEGDGNFKSELKVSSDLKRRKIGVRVPGTGLYY